MARIIDQAPGDNKLLYCYSGKVSCIISLPLFFIFYMEKTVYWHRTLIRFDV